MHTLFIVLHVVFCIFLILVILLQTGKGAGIGAAFGGGSSQTVFGPRGAGSFIGKLTGGVAAAFMITSLVLAYLSSSTSTGLAAKVQALNDEKAKRVEEVDLNAGSPSAGASKTASPTDKSKEKATESAQKQEVGATDGAAEKAEAKGTDAASSKPADENAGAAGETAKAPAPHGAGEPTKKAAAAEASAPAASVPAPSSAAEKKAGDTATNL